MRIFRHIGDLPVSARGAVVAIGNFDGLHRGHRQVIAAARGIARDGSRRFAALTFEPHPRAYFGRAAEPFRLTPFRIKVRAFQALGVETLFVLRFDRALAERPAEEFLADILHAAVAPSHVVVGYNFKFGAGRGGDFDLLAARSAALGFEVTRVAPARDGAGEVYSSTLIREHLEEGRPERAAALLGRLWEIEGRVREGRRLGHTIGFPTANMDLGEALRPARGVYAIRAGIRDGDGMRRHDGVANVGVRPTVDGETLVLEAHLFGFDGDLYGRHLRVAFVEFLRPERKFDGIDALKAQIADDARRARELLRARAPNPGEFIGPGM